MPLDELADEIIRLSEWHGKTPVLVIPREISLRTPFFLTLSQSLGKKTQRTVRIDWLRPLPGSFTIVHDWVARWVAERHNRVLRSRSLCGKTMTSIQITAAMARPSGKDGPLVIGLADSSMPLPAWTTAIHLGGSPSGEVALQS